VTKMEILVNDQHFTNAVVPVEISPFQWLKLKILGYVKVFDAKKPGWRGTLPFYIVKCKNCGQYFLDYPHGYSGYFTCPCKEELKCR